MNTRLLILKILCFTLLISCTEHHKEVSGRPNIVLVMADDQGWGDLSTHKNPYINTPHIDTFKTEGVSLERFFVAPVCAPTRAGLLSGQWGIRTGAWGVTNRDEVMRTETVTIAELLRQAGYKTGIFGKWHNGAQYPENPKGQGFDKFLGFTAGHWNNYFDTTLKNIDGMPVPTKGYITDVFTDAAIAFIKENKDRPFFCYIPYNAPHSPFQVPGHYFNTYKAKGINDKDACIYGMCENIDDNFGKLLNVLDKEHLATNTIVIFMSDNGPNGKRYNERMKGIKATNDEGGTRVPFFMRWPGKIPAGAQRNTIAGHIDIVPTLAKLCGIALPDDMVLDGLDISPLILGTDTKVADRYLYSHWSGPTWNAVPGSVRDNQYRLVLKREDTTLYDMRNDPYQLSDIFDTLPQVSGRMLNAYDTWIKDVYKEGMSKVPISIGYTSAPETRIEAHELNLNEGLAYFGKEGWANDWITQWDSEEDTVNVAIKVHKKGNYTFEIRYDCTDSQLGSEIALSIQGKELRKKVTKAFAGAYIPSPDRIRRKEVYEKTWGTMAMGALDLKEGMSLLNIYAKVAKDSVMHLKAIKITFNGEKIP